MLTPAESMQLGTHVAGDLVEIFLLFQNVDVPDPTPEFPDGGAISWSFLLVNGVREIWQRSWQQQRPQAML